MEAIPPTLNPELKLDGTVSQVINTCLTTPVLLRKILEQFSNSELLQLSLVNKQWNYEARCALKDHGNLAATILSNNPPCQDLVAFASDLSHMRVVPFSGVHLVLSHNDACQSVLDGSLDPSYKLILERLPCKNVSVEFRDNFETCRNCPALVFVQRLLDHFSGVLETLSLTMDWELVIRFEHLFPNRSFPWLKTLKLDMGNTSNAFKLFFKKFVSSAPNLKELHTVVDVAFDHKVLKGSSAVLVPLGGFHPLDHQVCESLLGALRPEIIEIYRPEVPFDDGLLTGFIPTLLEATRTSLKTLKMDLLFAILLMCYGICLENVTTLEIRLDGDLLNNLEPQLLALLKSFDFHRVFPTLNQIEFKYDFHPTLSQVTISPFLEQGMAMLRERSALLERVVNNLRLVIRGDFLRSTIQFLAQMFPNVKSVTAERENVLCETSFEFLWTHFKHLEELKLISFMYPNWINNFDSDFCGIFEEEVAEGAFRYYLREKDDEYLRAVNIVPVRPSMTCMKELRTLAFQCTPKTYSLRPPRSPFCFSKVTGWIVFARCPGLAVTFQTATSQCAEALSHMEPFVTFESVDARCVLETFD